MKKHKGLKTIGKILAVILVFLLVINIISCLQRFYFLKTYTRSFYYIKTAVNKRFM